MTKLTRTHRITRLAANPGRSRQSFTVLHLGLICIVYQKCPIIKTKPNKHKKIIIKEKSEIVECGGTGTGNSTNGRAGLLAELVRIRVFFFNSLVKKKLKIITNEGKKKR